MTWKALAEVPPWEWPANAPDQIVGALGDAKASDEDVMLACELAGELVGVTDELVRELVRLVESTERDEAVRAHAALALGPALEEMSSEAGAPSVFEEARRSLKRLYDDTAAPMLVRRRSLEASVRAPEAWHVDAVRSAWAGNDEAWKITAVFCMGFVRGFEAQILEALDSPIEDLKHEAVLAAGNAELDKAWPQIEPLLKPETNKPLLLAAIGATPFLRPDEAEDLLGPFIESEDEDIAAEAEGALELAYALIGEDTDPDEDED